MKLKAIKKFHRRTGTLYYYCEVLMHGSKLHRLGRRGAGPGEFARVGRMESGGRSERGPHPWCKTGPWVRVRRWPKRVACTMTRRAHGAGGGGRCARSVKSWFGRIESKCEERERVLLPGEGGEGAREKGGKRVQRDEVPLKGFGNSAL